MNTMEYKQAPTGIVQVSDEERLPPEPLPSVITPEWLNKRLQDFSNSLQFDVAMVVDKVVKHRLEGSSPNVSEQTKPRDASYLSTEEAAQYLGLTPKAVREGAVRGDLPGCKYPKNSKRGRWRFKARALDSWLKSTGGRPNTRRKREVSIW